MIGEGGCGEETIGVVGRAGDEAAGTGERQ